jgi:hypothetical protein
MAQTPVLATHSALESAVHRMNPKAHEIKHLQGLLKAETRRRVQYERLLMRHNIDLREVRLLCMISNTFIN